MISEKLEEAAAPKPTLHAEFKAAYLETLRHIVAFKEAETNALMNHLRRVMAKGIDTSDNMAVQIHADLTTNKDTIGYLYGDFHSNSTAPWIADQSTIDMIGRHLDLLGTEEDKTAFQSFVQETARFFKTPIAVTRQPQVA